MRSVSKRSTILRRCAATSALTLLAGFAGAAQAQEALPVGGAVTAGAATISGTPGTVTVDQTSARAIVNWQSFDVGAGNTVVFRQPDATAATLNRVTGGTSSTIAGQIVANGSVYLVNPNGIAITSTGSVRTGGGFVASTLDIVDADFAAGKLRFAGTGASRGVSNAGSITAGAGGYVALLGGTVSNAGTISVPLGRVALGAGERIALDLNGGGFLQVALPSDVAGTLIASSGSIAASGGRIELKAATAQDVVRGVVNVSGTLSADSATGNGGSIVLLGGDGGTVTAGGTFSARATGAVGDGGFVETSGHVVDFTGITVDTGAAQGATGTWLIDPTNLTVNAAAAATISTNLATSNVTLQTTAGGANGPGDQSTGNGDITIASAIGWTSANTLTLLAYNNIALNAAVTGTAGGLTLTTGNGAANTGSISATDAVSVGTFNLTNGRWMQNAAMLPGFAAADFRVTLRNASFLRAVGGIGSTASPYRIADVYGLQGIASSSLLGRSFRLANAVDALGTARWNGGAGFVAIGTDGAGNIWNVTAGFTGTLDGAGFAIAGLSINRASTAYQGLFGYVSATAALSNLGLTNLSVAGRGQTGALAGTASGTNVSITNVTAAGTVSGSTDTGGLIGLANGSSITNAHAAVAVTGGSESERVGGLVGRLVRSQVRSSAATGAVSGGRQVGGLVGLHGSGSSIADSYATGAVSGGLYAGGLAGVQNGTIARSYATGTVITTGSGNVYAGGLVGQSDGATSSVKDSYATGAVTASGSYAGGLIGSLTSSGNKLSNVYATGAVTGVSFVGGLVGLTETGTSVDSAYASGQVTSSTGASPVGGLIGQANGEILNAYWDNYSTGRDYAIGARTAALASVSAVTSDPARVPSAYWTFYLQLARASGLGTATPSGFVFMEGESTRPFLAFEVPVAGNPGVRTNAAGQIVLTNSHQLQLVGYNRTTLAASYVLGNAIDLAETSRVVVGTAASYAGMWAGTGFVAIGTYGTGVTDGTGFSGSFDGGGFAISGLTINRIAYYQGLFGYTSGSGSIGNVVLAGGSVRGQADVGSLIGYNGGTAVARVSSSTSVTGTIESVGGLIGYSRGTVTSSSASGAVIGGARYAGGLIGYSTAAVTSSSASGAVTSSSGMYTGGLIGEAGGAVTGSTASGAVAGGYSSTGGLIGIAGAGSIVTGSFATGNVTGSGMDVGGLIGQNNAALVSTSFATGAVKGENNVGGLIGSHDTSSKIDQTYASGAVTATGNGSSAGGLIGFAAAAAVSRSYATGSVSGTGYSGGLIGFSSATIEQSYASGAVSGGVYRGGLVGLQFSGSIANSVYWDSYSTGQNAAIGISSGGDPSAALAVTSNPAQAGIATSAYKTSAYANLTAADWVFFDGQTRPFGAWEVPVSGGTITNSHQLQLIGANAATLAGSYRLGGNINLAETRGVVAPTPSYAGMWAGTGFVSLGTNGAGLTWDGTTYKSVGTITSGTYGYSGTFDGGGYELVNLFINRANTNNTGLFGTVSGTIRNVAVDGRVIGGNGTGGLVGMLIGGPTTSTTGLSPVVSNARSTVNVTGLQVVGGLVGSAGQRSSVLNGTASGTVNGTNTVGGLIGSANRATVSGSASGAVTGLGYVGGLIGQQFAGTTTGYATGTVTGTTAVGGLIGVLDGTATERGTATATRAAQSTSGPSTADRNFGRVTAGGTATTQPVP